MKLVAEEEPQETKPVITKPEVTTSHSSPSYTTKPYNPTFNYTKPYNTPSSYTKPSNTTSNYTKPSSTLSYNKTSQGGKSLGTRYDSGSKTQATTRSYAPRSSASSSKKDSAQVINNPEAYAIGMIIKGFTNQLKLRNI